MHRPVWACDVTVPSECMLSARTMCRLTLGETGCMHTIDSRCDWGCFDGSEGGTLCRAEIPRNAGTAVALGHKASRPHYWSNLFCNVSPQGRHELVLRNAPAPPLQSPNAFACSMRAMETVHAWPKNTFANSGVKPLLMQHAYSLLSAARC